MFNRLLSRSAFYICALLGVLLLLGGIFERQHLFGITTGVVMLMFAVWINEPIRTAILARMGQEPTSLKESVSVGVVLLVLLVVLGGYFSAVDDRELAAQTTAKRTENNSKNVVSASPNNDRPSPAVPAEMTCEQAKSMALSGSEAEEVCSIMKRALERMPHAN